MHILFLSHYFPPEVNAPATRTFEHCRRWVREGHDVTVVTCAPNCPAGVVFPGYRNRWRTEEMVDGIRVVRVWTYIAANKGFARRVLNYLSYVLTAVWAAVRLRRVDVVVATSPQFFCGWAGVLVRWLRRKPLVLEIRDIWPESITAVGAMKPSRATRMLEWLERRMYAAADVIVTVGDGYRQRLLERGVPAEKVEVVPNGVDLRQFVPRPADQGLRAEWGGRGRLVCAYVGTVGMAHGLEVVLDAAERLRSLGRDDVAFWIIGDGAERERLEREAARRGLDAVRFMGLVPKDRVAEAIASCDACLVHLRGSELFASVVPSKIFEMMAMGVPIVMGVRGPAERIVLDAGAGVSMTPDDPGSLLTALDTVAAVTRSPGGFAGARRYVAEHYDRDRLARRMLDVLEGFAPHEQTAGVTGAADSGLAQA